MAITSGHSRQFASPRARRAMAALGLDPSAVRGSGPNGRIVEADVLQTRQSAGDATHSSGIPADASVVPLTEMRRAVARCTAESFATIPHFYLRSEIDAGALVALRTQLADEMHREHGVRPTITDFILCAMARALVKCPFANRVWHGDGLIELSSVDIGLQVAVENGLLAPVIRRADTLGLPGVAQQRSRLVAACLAGKLPADALGGGACSLSNLGISRVDELAAIIMPRQSSILAIGRAAPRPWVASGQLCVRTTVRLCLSVDHRVMDGLAAARFLDQIAESLENPSMLTVPPCQPSPGPD